MAIEKMISIVENAAPGQCINYEDINAVIDELGGEKHFGNSDRIDMAILYIALLIARKKT